MSNKPAAAAAAGALSWVTPGDVLGTTAELIAGTGTYVLEGQTAVYAGVVGIKRLTAVAGDAAGRSMVQVESGRPASRLPAVGDVVTARVTKINARMASVDILCLHTPVAAPADAAAATAAAVSSGASAAGAALATSGSETYILDESLAGTIRQRDVRAFDIDSVEIYKSFRPADLVRAQVLSLGDARSYFLSTARNDLGVVLATSPAGAPMLPINWEQMQCPVTGAKEFRKVAKIDA
jgi:exosome complex component CSL4